MEQIASQPLHPLLLLQVHKFLGLKVGLVQADMKPDQRREAYASDVTYVTNSELGFDYLRDNLAQVSSQRRG